MRACHCLGIVTASLCGIALSTYAEEEWMRRAGSASSVVHITCLMVNLWIDVHEAKEKSLMRRRLKRRL